MALRDAARDSQRARDSPEILPCPRQSNRADWRRGSQAYRRAARRDHARSCLQGLHMLYDMSAQPWMRLRFQRMKRDQVDRSPQRCLDGVLQSRQAEEGGALRRLDGQVEVALSPPLVARIGADNVGAANAMLAQDADAELALAEPAYVRVR